jgi:predicted peroxiredoxin
VRGCQINSSARKAELTHASDDPTKSSLAFITAAGALEAGKEIAIVLLGEGVVSF